MKTNVRCTQMMLCRKAQMKKLARNSEFLGEGDGALRGEAACRRPASGRRSAASLRTRAMQSIAVFASNRHRQTEKSARKERFFSLGGGDTEKTAAVPYCSPQANNLAHLR